MLLDTKNKKIIFAVIMIIIWGTGGVVYAAKGNPWLSVAAFAVVLGMGVKLYSTMKKSEK
ncbi:MULTISPECIES: hypothetical protein [Paenibacillus]|uniref:Uncharacterized protein n=2 Tax=Paenibacillus TaxID=44249 RepID=A0ABW3DHM6_9BACL|nr:hypothetical protein [Aneurinibacillus sp. XH2]